MKIDGESPRYPYLQVADYLRDQVRAGKLGPRLPSALTLSGDIGASVATVKRAFKVLHDEGLIYSVNGLGTFVKGAS